MLRAPKQLIATKVLKTTAPNFPITTRPKSRATVFDEATVSGERATKYAQLAKTKRTRTSHIDECRARGRCLFGFFISPATNYPRSAMLDSCVVKSANETRNSYITLIPSVECPQSRVQGNSISARLSTGALEERLRAKCRSRPIPDQSQQT